MGGDPNIEAYSPSESSSSSLSTEDISKSRLLEVVPLVPGIQMLSMHSASGAHTSVQQVVFKAVGEYFLDNGGMEIEGDLLRRRLLVH